MSAADQIQTGTFFSPPMFLTAEEVARLTGRERPKAQQRFLYRAYIPYTVDADGRTLVLRSTIEGTRVTIEKPSQPNWSALA